MWFFFLGGVTRFIMMLDRRGTDICKFRLVTVGVSHGHVAKGTSRNALDESNWIYKPMWGVPYDFKTHPDNQWHVMKDDDISFENDNINMKTTFLLVWHSAGSFIIHDSEQSWSPTARVTGHVFSTLRFMLSWNILIPSPISNFAANLVTELLILTSLVIYTPKKTNGWRAPKWWALEMVTPFFLWPFLVFMLNFWGVTHELCDHYWKRGVDLGKTVDNPVYFIISWVSWKEGQSTSLY